MQTPADSSSCWQNRVANAHNHMSKQSRRNIPDICKLRRDLDRCSNNVIMSSLANLYRGTQMLFFEYFHYTCVDSMISVIHLQCTTLCQKLCFVYVAIAKMRACAFRRVQSDLENAQMRFHICFPCPGRLCLQFARHAKWIRKHQREFAIFCFTVQAFTACIL